MISLVRNWVQGTALVEGAKPLHTLPGQHTSYPLRTGRTYLKAWAGLW